LLRLQWGRSDEFETVLNTKSEEKEMVVRALAIDRSPIMSGCIRWEFQDIDCRMNADQARHELMARLVASQENERRRISREIHDQFGQELTVLSFALKDLEADIPEGTSGRRRLRSLKEAVDRLGHFAHELAFDLRPAALDDLGLRAAVEALVQ